VKNLSKNSYSLSTYSKDVDELLVDNAKEDDVSVGLQRNISLPTYKDTRHKTLPMQATVAVPMSQRQKEALTDPTNPIWHQCGRK
jgi:hypothetical protein